MLVGRSDAEHPLEVLFQRQSILITPLAADDERDRVSWRERAPHLLVRQNTVLHTAWIEERRETRVIGTPEFVVKRQERAFDRLAVLVEEQHVGNTARPP